MIKGKVEKVAMYYTTDGEFHDTREEAEKIQDVINMKVEEEELIKSMASDIKQLELTTIQEVENENAQIGELGEPSIQQWKCESKDNPITRCINVYSQYDDKDCCVYCGSPDERK